MTSCELNQRSYGRARCTMHGVKRYDITNFIKHNTCNSNCALIYLYRYKGLLLLIHGSGGICCQHHGLP